MPYDTVGRWARSSWVRSTGRVHLVEVVEVRIERGRVVDPAVVEAHVNAGREVHAVVHGTPSPDRGADTVAGWEIGAVASLLGAGAVAVTGVDERRVERVRAVLRAMEEAR